MKEKKSHPLRWIIWSLAVSFYFYEYFVRVFPSTMTHELSSFFKINSTGLGMLSALYLYAYAPFQLLAGPLMDRFGAKKLITLACFVCGLAVFLFSITKSILMADITRLLMGAASAFGFIGLVYVTSHWFSKKKLALLVGIGNSFGMLGAIFGLIVLSSLLEIIAWNTLLYILALLGISLALCIFLAIRKEPEETSIRQKIEETSSREKIGIVLKNPQSWINSLVALTYYAVTVSFAGMWSTPFLKAIHNLSNAQAGLASSMIFTGWIVAAPIVGHFSDKIGARKPFLLTIPLLSLVLLIPIIYFPPIPYYLIIPMMLLIGIGASTQLLTYSLAVELNPDKCKGTSLALTNFLTFLFGAIVQTLVGYILSLYQITIDEEAKFQVGSFLVTGYKMAMSIFPLTIILGFIFSWFLCEKKPKKFTTYH